MDISGATSPNYYPTDDYVGKAIGVEIVGFTDSDEFTNEGSFANATTAVVTDLVPSRSLLDAGHPVSEILGERMGKEKGPTAARTECLNTSRRPQNRLA